MRIRRLEIQAFGPFAGREIIDFEQLSAAGLFLLNGATGAGKTSVLDAICFALYGSVPGVRQEGRRLRSDHADASTVPEVVCEFTASGRTFEVTRSPAWQRPSKRAASGSTPEQAKTLLREYVDGVWQEKSARNDEAAQEITDLLGMNAKQFTRVVMLPQGDFAAFLRSDAQSRQELLQQLFGTERFKSVEQQLNADAGAAREKLAAADAAVEGLLRKAEDEAAKHPVESGTMPADPDADGVLDLDGVQDPDEGKDDGRGEQPNEISRVQGWIDGLRVLAEQAAEAELTARHSVESSQTELQELTARQGRFAKLESARRLQTELAAAQGRQTERQELQRLHRAAEVLTGRLDTAEDAALAHEGCRQAAVEQIERLLAHRLYRSCLAAEPGMEPDHELADLDAAETQLSGQLALLEDLLPQEQEYRNKLAQLASTEKRAQEAASAAEDGQRRLAELDQQLTELDDSLRLHREGAANIEHLRAEMRQAADVVSAVQKYQLQLMEEHRLQDEHAQAQSGHLAAKERWLTLLQERLEHMAAELAQQLEAGGPCPVCGSCEHPAPAGGAAGSAAQEEEAAQQAQEAALELLQRTEQRLATIQRELAVLAAQGGEQQPQAAERRAAETAAGAAAAEAAQKLVDRVQNQREQAEQHQKALSETCRLNAAAAAEASAETKALARQCSDLDRKLESARADYGTLSERIDDLQTFRLLVAAAVRSLRKQHTAAAQESGTREALESEIADSVFSSAQEARAALLAPAEAEALTRSIEEHQRARHRLDAVLAEAEVQQAEQEEKSGLHGPPEAALKAAQEALAAGSEAAHQAAVEQRLVEASLQRLAALLKDLAAALAAAKPVREHCELLSALAELARGAGENSYKMTLNTYVLAARLEQVAVCATERLRTMTSGRYSLVYSDSRAFRGAKSGLGLHVVDEWTGRQRDTATLSGGESFMASLALALGLADVVQQESGGVDIETLFVDEGFGSLDEEALEQVMDALEGLRDGGRVVGLVSHVAEMKLRITAQLQVHKSRTGSTVSMREAGLVDA